MNIRLTTTSYGTRFEALCDLCSEPMEMTETVNYLMPSLGRKGERRTKNNSASAASENAVDPYAANGGDIICHNECYRERIIPGWASMTTVESLINQLLDGHNSRHPGLASFIKTLNERSPKPIR
jgi:hypothetical protein